MHLTFCVAAYGLVQFRADAELQSEEEGGKKLREKRGIKEED